VKTVQRWETNGLGRPPVVNDDLVGFEVLVAARTNDAMSKISRARKLRVASG
jgi:hypothetical protein